MITRQKVDGNREPPQDLKRSAENLPVQLVGFEHVPAHNNKVRVLFLRYPAHPRNRVEASLGVARAGLSR